MMENNRLWNPSNWRTRKRFQLPEYLSSPEFLKVEKRIQNYPSLVSINEIRQLKNQLAAVSKRRAFILQGGDCAESFADFHPQVIHSHFSLMCEMATKISKQTNKPVLQIGRIAGQYAKPRSQETETVNGVELPSYRGDIINGVQFNDTARRYDPARMERAYFTAAGTLNLLRSLADPAYRNTSLSAVGNSYFTSHEALLLPYEQAQLEQDESGNWYCCSGHFLWVGERTRQLDGAHIEFLRGIQNPIGVKIGPTIKIDELLHLVEILNPNNELGRLTLITRVGATQISQLLPLLEAVKAEGLAVCWLCDPMHGNGIKTASGIKTRHFDTVMAEVEGFIEAHQAAGTYPAGVHLEMTGLSVTECLGGPPALTENDLQQDYQSQCDPRLNHEQALELAAVLARQLAPFRLKEPLVTTSIPLTTSEPANNCEATPYLRRHSSA